MNALKRIEADWTELRRRRMTIAAMRRWGWRRIDGGRGKLFAIWRHVDGWTLQHCGHPTALTPWALYDERGRMHCTGSVWSGDRRNGTAWPNLALAVAYVAACVAERRALVDARG